MTARVPGSAGFPGGSGTAVPCGGTWSGQRWVARCAEPFLGEECNELRGILVFVTELRLALRS